MFKSLLSDCRYFKGYKPCFLHKTTGVRCNLCAAYRKTREKLLIIKLGALGDVIRTTPILRRFNKEDSAAVWWLTRYPEVIPGTWTNVLPFNLESILQIQAIEFDVAYNFDKDAEACGLLKQVKARRKYGFTLCGGKPAPAHMLSYHKYGTGLDDEYSKANKKSYQEELFEMCGLKFRGEEYIVECDEKVKIGLGNKTKKKIVGLNTGCGVRWPTRLWKEEYWITLAQMIKQAGYSVLMLGGEKEHYKNYRIAHRANVSYMGHYPYQTFVGFVDQCDLVVTGITAAMHIALGLKKKVIALNSIFNKNEFEMYDRGEVVEPDIPCQCYFEPRCTNETFCMNSLKPEKVFKIIQKYLEKS